MKHWALEKKHDRRIKKNKTLCYLYIWYQNKTKTKQTQNKTKQKTNKQKNQASKLFYEENADKVM